MDVPDAISLDKICAELPSSKNPFMHTIHISKFRRIQLLLFAVFVFPIRLFFMVIFLLLTLFIGELATRGVDFSRPFSGLRQRLLLPVFMFCCRALFLSSGFTWVGQRGRRASCAEAPIIVIVPHSSFYDALVFLALGMPSAVGKVETATSPIGSFIKMTQPILVNREDSASRQKTLAEIRKRALSGGEWPQILIFPEGTCTNRSCVINFKQGKLNLTSKLQPWTALLSCLFCCRSIHGRVSCSTGYSTMELRYRKCDILKTVISFIKVLRKGFFQCLSSERGDLDASDWGTALYLSQNNIWPVRRKRFSPIFNSFAATYFWNLHVT